MQLLIGNIKQLKSHTDGASILVQFFFLEEQEKFESKNFYIYENINIQFVRGSYLKDILQVHWTFFKSMIRMHFRARKTVKLDLGLIEIIHIGGEGETQLDRSLSILAAAGTKRPMRR